MSATVQSGTTLKLSDDDLLAMTDTLIQLHELRAEKKKEVSKINEQYNAIKERIKQHMVEDELQYIDHKGFQIQTYERKREPSLNVEFITSGLSTFFQEARVPVNASNTAKQASIYLEELKKNKANGIPIWTTTIRNITKKRDRDRESRKMRKSKKAKVDSEYDGDNDKEDVTGISASDNTHLLKRVDL